ERPYPRGHPGDRLALVGVPGPAGATGLVEDLRDLGHRGGGVAGGQGGSGHVELPGGLVDDLPDGDRAQVQLVKRPAVRPYRLQRQLGPLGGQAPQQLQGVHPTGAIGTGGGERRGGRGPGRRSRAATSASAGRTSPVTVDTIVRASGAKDTPDRCSPKATAAGATASEWKAWDTAMRVQNRPCAPARAPTSSQAATGPDPTVCCGLL